MEDKNEMLIAARNIRKYLGESPDTHTAEALAAFEGLAPFLNRAAIIKIKCRGCDSYAQSSFSHSGDFSAIDRHDYCHARNLSMENLDILKLSSCTEHSMKAQLDLANLANAILEEDLRPAFKERKLYNKRLFASYKAALRMDQGAGNIYIEFGHESDEGQFMPSDLRLYLLRRLDPGFGPEASQKIAAVLKDLPIMFVSSSQQTRRQLDIDYILEWIAKKRKMDIVYL